MKNAVKTFILTNVIILLIILQINVVKAQNTDILYFNHLNPVFGRIVNSEISRPSGFVIPKARI